MAHFAKLIVGNIIETVHVVSNDIAITEQAGVDFLNTLHGSRDAWVQTSYNGNFRKNFAGVGHTYDKIRDAFIAPKPYPSWVLVEDTCQWEAPTAMPDDGQAYAWDEDTTSWVVIA